jgi:7,8-dihydroneopterin aldolase/epimerase/oxygenase
VTVVVELAGLEVQGRHGVEEQEQQSEQPFLYDIRLELPEPKSDRIEDTVDYRDVVELLKEISEAREFSLLEALAGAVAEALLQRFPEVEHARVRVRKPRVQLGTAVDYAAATVERSRG